MIPPIETFATAREIVDYHSLYFADMSPAEREQAGATLVALPNCPQGIKARVERGQVVDPVRWMQWRTARARLVLSRNDEGEPRTVTFAALVAGVTDVTHVGVLCEDPARPDRKYSWHAELGVTVAQAAIDKLGSPMFLDYEVFRDGVPVDYDVLKVVEAGEVVADTRERCGGMSFACAAKRHVGFHVRLPQPDDLDGVDPDAVAFTLRVQAWTRGLRMSPRTTP